jgi:CAAX protease family protein
MLIGAVAGTVLQLGFVAALCASAWLVFARRRTGFRRWLGLQKAPLRSVALGLALGASGAAILISVPSIREAAGGAGSVPRSALADGNGASAFVALVILAPFKTALAEELLFRGLIGKRLIAGLGFGLGNACQAALFGAAHLLVALTPLATTGLVAALVVFTAVAGFINGWLNEKRGGGSILPGWAAHASANLIAYAAATAL